MSSLIKSCVTIATVLMLSIGASPASAENADQAIGFLSQQRVAAGINPISSEDANLSQGCASHLNYLALNYNQIKASGVSPHTEKEDWPGYTDLGDLASGKSDLVWGPGSTPNLWSSTENPWMGSFAYSPIHFAQLFYPTSNQAWYADDGSQYCMGTNWADSVYALPSDTAPTPFSFPGPNQTGIPYKVIDTESPFSPNDLVGLGDQTTGPNLLFYLRAAVATPPSVVASLSGPEGTIDTRTVQPSTIKGYLPNTTFVIPVSPLQMNSSYVANLTWTYEGSSYQQQVHFQTNDKALPSNVFETDEVTDDSENSNKVRTPRLKLKVREISHRDVTIQITAAQVLNGHRVSLSVNYLGCQPECKDFLTRRSWRLQQKKTVSIPRDHASVLRIIARTRSFKEQGIRYRARRTTIRVRFSK